MASMTNQASTITSTEMERIKWIENEIHLNNLTSANGSRFMAAVYYLLSFILLYYLYSLLLVPNFK